MGFGLLSQVTAALSCFEDKCACESTEHAPAPVFIDLSGIQIIYIMVMVVIIDCGYFVYEQM